MDIKVLILSAYIIFKEKKSAKLLHLCDSCFCGIRDLFAGGKIVELFCEKKICTSRALRLDEIFSAQRESKRRHFGEI